MRKSLILAAAAAAAAAANGGPVDWASELGAGDPRPGSVRQVRLVSESLTVVVGDSLVDATAVYELENTGGAVSVDYAIPVHSLAEPYGVEEPGAARVALIGGEGRIPLEAVVSEDSVAHPEGWTAPGLVTWHTAELAFDSAETRTLTARVTMPPHYQDFATTKSFFPSWSTRCFRWVLAPAAGWGDGTAGRFVCRLDLTEALELGCQVDSVSGPGGWAEDGVWAAEETDFDMASAPPLEVCWRADSLLLRRFLQRHALTSAQVPAVRASSVLEDQGTIGYGPRNLLDGDLSTAWAEGAPGPGRGAGIVVELPEGFRLGCIAIANGYRRSPQTLRENARAAHITYGLELGEDWSGDSVTYGGADLADPLDDGYDPAGLGPLQLLFDTGDPLPAREVRIEVTEVHPGTSYDDLCISELLLLGSWEGRR
jgi:hypothetical protein